MVSKKYWKKSIFDFINLVKSEHTINDIEILNFRFKILVGVFSPIYSSDTEWFAKKVVPLTKKKKFLEIGSGSGVIACLASLNGASRVVATDINPKAVENIHLNAKLHSLNISIKEGSVFEPIDENELYDLIFWNHPFYYTDNESSFEKDMITASVCDEKYRYLHNFFREGKKYLCKGGRLLLGTSNVAKLNLIKKIAREEGYAFEVIYKTDVPIYKDRKIKMDIRLISFTVKNSRL